MNAQELNKSYEDTYISLAKNEISEDSYEISENYLIAKRVLDFTLSLAALILFSPMMIIIAAAVKLTSPGPAIYKQERVGRGGRTFVIYKFRTMIDGAENLKSYLSPLLMEIYMKNRKLNNDPRITKVGSVLRKLSLDELPQLINIFKGDMSIVGPRPMMPEETEMYGKNYNLYKKVKPGLTGLWQIMSRSQTMMSDRARLDAEYISDINIAKDIIIIFKTFGTVISRKGAC